MPQIIVSEPPDEEQVSYSIQATRADTTSDVDENGTVGDTPRSSASSNTRHSTAPLQSNHLTVPGPENAGARGRGRSSSTATSPETTLLNPDHPPPLDSWHFSLKGPLLYLVFLLICNLAIPCLLYYLLRANTHLTDKELIGIGSAALGLSSCFDAPFRVWKLTRHRAKYGPLYYPYAPDPAFEPAGKRWLPKEMPRSWWHMDFTMYAYQCGLFSMAVPLAIAPSIPLFNFYLFSLAMLIIPVMIIFALTLRVWHSLPFWCSSDPPRTPTKPACYYLLEDVGAVDFKHGREWRKRCQARYAASPPFRAMMWNQTVLWTFGMAVFVGVTAAVDWTADLDFAFGFVLGLFFLWALVWGLLSYWHVHLSLRRELAWWRAQYASTVCSGIVPHHIEVPASTPTPAGREDAEGGGGGGGQGRPKLEGGAGVEHEGEYKGGRTRGYSVHARLELSPQQEMAQVGTSQGVMTQSGTDRAGAAARFV